jgi:hypothetical protein
MKSTSSAFKAHLAQPYQTTCQCLRVALRNGTVLRFTDHDSNIMISGWTGGDSILNGAYLAAAGFFATDVVTSDALNVDNTEISGPQTTPAIIEADLSAGAWDFAAYRLFLVNWADLSSTMGRHYLRVGHIGEVTIEDGRFKAEVRGIMQAYVATVGELTSPACRANLGDARCAKDLTGFTVTSTLTGVNADNMTLYDTARAEAGPSIGVAITGITNANPGVVTMANDSLHLVDDQPITISGVVGPVLLNAVTLAQSPTGATFQLGIDTSDTAIYPAYSSGGTVRAFGGTGYFDYGVMTFTSGLNSGLSMEVKAYVPGQITLAQPMPYLCAIGDAYSMHAGCDKAFETCRDRFANVVNFRGEPHIGGVDKLVQVGRHV